MNNKDLRIIHRAAVDGQRGMTLLEIMIVLAIIALVMGLLIGPSVMNAFSDSKVKTSKMAVEKVVNEAYPRWSADNPGEGCPEKVDDLGHYVDQLKDSWGNELILLCGDDAPEGKSFCAVSKGEDGKRDDSDDGDDIMICQN